MFYLPASKSLIPWSSVGCLLLAAAVVASPTGRGRNGYLSCNGGPCAESPLLEEGAVHVGRSRTARAGDSYIVLRLRGHRDVCTPQEVRQAACLNGLCYALALAYMRRAFCECPEKYEGARCEKLSLDFYLVMSAGAAVKGAIIGGVVFGLLILVIVLSVCCYKIKKRRKEKRARLEGEAAETLYTPPPQRENSRKRSIELTPESQALTQPGMTHEETEMTLLNSKGKDELANGDGHLSF